MADRGAKRLLCSREEGSSAVEFAIFAPIFCLILAGTTDIGFSILTKFTLNGTLSAGANYALLRAEDVGSAKGADLASRIATIVVGPQPSNEISASVVVNNGPKVTIAGGAGTFSGTAARADSCYCPTMQNGSLAWGGALACGASCSAGSTTAGKYVAISVSRAYTPLFVGYRFIQANAIPLQTVVRTQ